MLSCHRTQSHSVAAYDQKNNQLGATNVAATTQAISSFVFITVLLVWRLRNCDATAATRYYSFRLRVVLLLLLLSVILAFYDGICFFTCVFCCFLITTALSAQRHACLLQLQPFMVAFSGRGRIYCTFL